MRLIAVLSFIVIFFRVNGQEVACTAEELKLYEMLNEYRSRLKLPRVPLSPALCVVAQTHARDLAENHPYDYRCNLHSWSSKGPWTPCCYTQGQEQALCMWKKPAELTDYKGYGYEIAYWNNLHYDDPAGIAYDALKAWKKSRAHHAVIINKDIWKQFSWKAMGVGIYKGYVLVWFGTEPDTPL
jgi:uncharacterized protein YkwD